MRTAWGGALAAACGLALSSNVSSCGDGAAQDATSATALIGTEGGTLTLASVTLVIPANALDAPTSITIVKTSEPAPMDDDACSPVYRFEPGGLAFRAPVALSIAHDRGGNDAALFWTQTGDDSAFDRIEGADSGGILTASITHFSRGFCGVEKCRPREACVLGPNCEKVLVTCAPSGRDVVRTCTCTGDVYGCDAPSQRSCTSQDGGPDAMPADAATDAQVDGPALPPTWSPTGGLGALREQHGSDTLPNGSVLVTGGEDVAGIVASAELYDPATKLWTVAESMGYPRQGHATVLLQNGRLLAAGGFTDLTGVPTASAELYEPVSGRWSPTTNAMASARVNFAVSLLPNGRVLASGGRFGGGAFYTNAADLFDPASSSWASTGAMGTSRTQHSSTLLPSGKVLVVGGFGGGSPKTLATAEIYDPSTGSWTPTGAMPAARSQHVAVRLTSGKVLVVGGSTGSAALATALVYDPATGLWSSTGSMSTARTLCTATVLDSGRVLVVGGDSSPASPTVLQTAEVYDLVMGTWSSAGTMAVAREAHGASRLLTGDVLVSGGYVGGTPVLTSSSELFRPGSL